MRSRGDISGNVQIGNGHTLYSPGDLRNNVQIGSSATPKITTKYMKGDEVVVLSSANLMIGTKVIASARKGEKLIVEKTQGNWVGVCRDDITAWVESRYVTLSKVKRGSGADEVADVGGDLGGEYRVSLKYYVMSSRRSGLAKKLRDERDRRSEISQEEQEKSHAASMEEHRRQLETMNEQIADMEKKMNELGEKMRNAKDAATIMKLSEEMKRVSSNAKSKIRESSQGNTAKRRKTLNSHRGRMAGAFQGEVPDLQGDLVVTSGAPLRQMVKLANRDFLMECELKAKQPSVSLSLSLRELGDDKSPIVIEFPEGRFELGEPALQTQMNIGPSPSGYACIVEVNKQDTPSSRPGG